MNRGIIDTYRNYRNIRRQIKTNSPYNIKFYNFWKQQVTDMWFYKFLENCDGIDNNKICFYSTFGSRNILNRTKGDVNIFFTGENVKRGNHKLYSDHFLTNDSIDLAMGFESFEDSRYLRFPLWIMYMFEPKLDANSIKARCQALNHQHTSPQRKFASHISSEDTLGLRRQMCECLSQIASVDCAGKIMHNCDDLWEKYNDDKHRFIANYKFNICPENSNCTGYVTEKIFQAIDAGCIPIYWGSYNKPEPQVLNHDAILFWEQGKNNDTLIKTINDLYTSEARYIQFASQARLTDDAAEYVINEYEQLQSRISEIIKNL